MNELETINPSCARETAYMSIRRWLDQENMDYPYNKRIFSYKEILI